MALRTGQDRCRGTSARLIRRSVARPGPGAGAFRQVSTLRLTAYPGPGFQVTWCSALLRRGGLDPGGMSRAVGRCWYCCCWWCLVGCQWRRWCRRHRVMW